MKLLLDENIHGILLFFLQEKGHDVKRVMQGSRDKIIFECAQQEHRMLITRDANFLGPQYLFRQHYGIILIRIPARDVETQKKGLVEVLSKNIKFEGRIVKIEADKIDMI